MKDHRSYEIYSGFNFSTATLYFCILNDTMSSREFCLTNCKLSEGIGTSLGLGNSLATYGSRPRNNRYCLHLRLRQSHSFLPPFVRMNCGEIENNPVAFRCWLRNCDDLPLAKNVIPQLTYMNVRGEGGGGLKVTFAKWAGGFEPHFTHFQHPPPPHFPVNFVRSLNRVNLVSRAISALTFWKWRWPWERGWNRVSI